MNSQTVLLVEDNDDDIELTQRAFGKNHIVNTLRVVRSGEEALDFLFRRAAYAERPSAETPALILLDLKLGALSGLDVLQTLRNDPSTSMIPIVVLTSSNESRDIHESYRMGANSYIRKPVDFDRFLDVTRQLGLYWLMLNEPPPVPSKEKTPPEGFVK